MFDKIKRKVDETLGISKSLGIDDWNAIAEKEGPTKPSDVTQNPKEWKDKLKKEKQKRKLKERLAAFTKRKQSGGKSW